MTYGTSSTYTLDGLTSSTAYLGSAGSFYTLIYAAFGMFFTVGGGIILFPGAAGTRIAGLGGATVFTFAGICISLSIGVFSYFWIIGSAMMEGNYGLETLASGTIKGIGVVYIFIGKGSC